MEDQDPPDMEMTCLQFVQNICGILSGIPRMMAILIRRMMIYLRYPVLELGLSLVAILKNSRFFPECVARVPVSLWGSGG